MSAGGLRAREGSVPTLAIATRNAQRRLAPHHRHRNDSFSVASALISSPCTSFTVIPAVSSVAAMSFCWSSKSCFVASMFSAWSYTLSCSTSCSSSSICCFCAVPHITVRSSAPPFPCPHAPGDGVDRPSTTRTESAVIAPTKNLFFVSPRLAAANFSCSLLAQEVLRERSRSPRHSQ